MGRQRFIAAMMCEGSRGSNRSATRKRPLTSRARRLSEEAVQYNAKRRPEAATPASAIERAEGSESAKTKATTWRAVLATAARFVALRSEEKSARAFTQNDERQTINARGPTYQLSGGPLAGRRSNAGLGSVQSLNDLVRSY